MTALRAAPAAEPAGTRSGEQYQRRSVLGSPLMWRHRGLSGKLRWHVNAILTRHPRVLNAFGATLTVVDAYGAPGDTLLTATICRRLRQRYPRLRINCLTPNVDLLQQDPHLNAVGEPESFFSVWSWYPELVARRDARTNVLRETFSRMGLDSDPYEYKCQVYLSDDERRAGRALLKGATRPVLTFHARTGQQVKDWPAESWRAAIAQLRTQFHVVQLGDDREPMIEGVQRLAGRLTFRESMSVLAHARLHVGGDSFLMHAANGLDVPSVIIFGGSRTPSNLGYAGNVNLYVDMPCGPCWIQANHGERCEYEVACMQQISPAQVVAAIEKLSGVRI